MLTMTESFSKLEIKIGNNTEEHFDITKLAIHYREISHPVNFFY